MAVWMALEYALERMRMKIAEALALRADLQKRLEPLKQRMVKNARIQEGGAPEEVLTSCRRTHLPSEMS